MQTTTSAQRTYVDTSAMVALFAREPSATAVLNQLDVAQADGPLVVSDWVITEVASALGIKRRRGELNATEHRAIWQSFSAECGAWFAVEPVATADFVIATEYCLSTTDALRGGDAMHLATANRTRCTAFLSLDDVLNRNARAQGLRVFSL
jgi:predicted nucleic acid-binding protein